jgi:hypothetical protein
MSTKWGFVGIVVVFCVMTAICVWGFLLTIS